MSRVPARLQHRHAVGLVLLLGVIVTCCRPVVASQPSARKFLVVGYLPEYRVGNLDETVCQHLDELVFFSVEPRSNGTLDTSRLKPAAVKLLRNLKQKYRFRLRLCIGGWERSTAFATCTADDAEGQHSTLLQARKDIQRLREAGIPAARICLGLPFYGRSLNKTRTAHTYAEIVGRFAPAPTVDQINGIYFNGPSTIRRKTRLADSGGLAGVSIWEIGQDVRGPRSLLRVISQSRRVTTDRR